MSKPSNDPRLHELAKSFHMLPEFEDEGGERGTYLSERSSETPLKHFSIMPGGRMLGARFFLRGRNRYVAYAPAKRQTDILRFADMMAMRLWKYRARAKHRDPEDTDLNFTVQMAQQDLDDFETERRDVMALIDAIEKHFLEIGLIRDAHTPLNPGEDPRVRKTARSEFLACHRTQLKLAEQRHQELLDSIAMVVERLDEVTKRLDTLETQTSPVMEVVPYTTCEGGMGATHYPVAVAKDHLVVNPDYAKAPTKEVLQGAFVSLGGQEIAKQETERLEKRLAAQDLPLTINCDKFPENYGETVRPVDEQPQADGSNFLPKATEQ